VNYYIKKTINLIAYYLKVWYNISQRIIKGGADNMNNLEYLESIKKADEKLTLKDIDWFTHRKIKALEIIAEELCKLNSREDNKYNGDYAEQSHDHRG